MASSREHNLAQDEHENESHRLVMRTPLRVLMTMFAVAALSACSTGGVNLSANGSRWGAPVNANVRIGHKKRHQRNDRYAQSPQPAGSGAHQKIGRPYQIAGRTYVPARQDDYDRQGVASWYGSKFDGRKTANGEIFDMNGMSAAHTTLPLPSLVRVTNLENGRTIIVRVNDRGPFVNNRLIDLSKGAARELGYLRQGVTRVRVQYVGPAVSNPGRANVYRASTRTRASARSAQPEASVWPAPKAATPTPVQKQPYAFGESWPEESKDKYQIALSRPRIAVGGWFVQLGAFGNRDRAEQIAARLRTSGKASVQTAWVNNHYIHRVLVGPYDNRDGAEQQRYEVADAGFPEARVTEQR
ncbi:MAG: septal ring lytic transglycosylase RlpA family lipoprotein [Robiginitomaculum sp.]|nr:MAG: septal ring lytic transglycosylase RlpA family lipoprotein [Robiginitomaculum sp.]